MDALQRFRATWPGAPVTASKNLEPLRNFFRFCVDSKWMESNPAKAVCSADPTSLLAPPADHRARVSLKVYPSGLKVPRRTYPTGSVTSVWVLFPLLTV